MNKLLLITILVIACGQAFAKTLVVSDVDDTIKITDVLGPKAKIVYNALFKTTSFTGSSELFQAFDEAGHTIYYVSGSPSFILENIDDFLKVNKLPQSKNVILKKSLREDTFAYKVEAITNLIDKQRPSALILIGDDTEYDPAVYLEIMKRFPGIKTNTYIRVVKNAELNETDNFKTFFSPVEIAGYEALEEQLPLNALFKVSNAYLVGSKGTAPTIKGRYCPEQGRDSILEMLDRFASRQALLLLEKTQQKIIDICSK